MIFKKRKEKKSLLSFSGNLIQMYRNVLQIRKKVNVITKFSNWFLFW